MAPTIWTVPWNLVQCWVSSTFFLSNWISYWIMEVCRAIGNIHYNYALTVVFLYSWSLCSKQLIFKISVWRAKGKNKWRHQRRILMKRWGYLGPLVLQFSTWKFKRWPVCFLKYHHFIGLFELFENLMLHFRCHSQIRAILFPVCVVHCGSMG
jgi:hypothetical protein